MTAIVYRADYGVPGAVTREDQRHIEAVALDPGSPFAEFGLPGKIVSGKFVPITAQNDVVYGYLVRPYPFNSSTDGLGTSTPPTTGAANVLRRGYLCVKNRAGTPAVGGAVNIRYQNPGSGKIVGDVEFTSSGDTYATTTARFTSQQDANSNAELFVSCV